MRNKRFIVLLIALFVLIAIIFTVAFFAKRNETPADNPVPLPTRLNQTEEPTEEPFTERTEYTVGPELTEIPEHTDKPNPTPYVPSPVLTNPPHVQNTPKPTSIPHSSPVYGKAYTLTILGTKVSVSIGVDNSTLDKTPGWLETSAYPGEEGVCVIYGHRNRNHFQVLKDIDFGDTITVTLADGTKLNYTVESIRILNPDEELRVPFISGQHLMLTTCYPFFYTGHAPQKFVLIANRF